MKKNLKPPRQAGTMMDGDDRKAAILDIAYEMAAEMDLSQITASKIGTRLGCSHTLVFIRWGTIVALREAVGRRAIERRDVPIVLKLLASRFLLGEIPASLRREVAASLYV